MLRLVLLRLLESYFRHRWLYLMPIVLMMGIGTVSFVNAKPVYTASSKLNVQDAFVREDAFYWVTPADATVDEFKRLLDTDAFVRAIVQQTNLENEINEGEKVDDVIDEMRDAVQVQADGKNLVKVTSTHKDPQVAYQSAVATIGMYKLFKINANREESSTTQDFFAEQVEAHQNTLEEAREELKVYLEQHPEPIRETEALEIERLQSAIKQAEVRLANAQQNEENARLATDQVESDVLQTYRVTEVNLPTERETSKKDALISVIVGVILSAGGIIGGGLLDRTFRFPIDVRHGIGLPVLAVIPNASGASKPWWRFW